MYISPSFFCTKNVAVPYFHGRPNRLHLHLRHYAAFASGLRAFSGRSNDMYFAESSATADFSKRCPSRIGGLIAPNAGGGARDRPFDKSGMTRAW
jgi:hypothetical protein